MFINILCNTNYNMDRATYEQLDRIEDQNNDIIEAMDLIKQHLGISEPDDLGDNIDEDSDSEEPLPTNKARKRFKDLDF